MSMLTVNVRKKWRVNATKVLGLGLVECTSTGLGLSHA